MINNLQKECKLLRIPQIATYNQETSQQGHLEKKWQQMADKALNQARPVMNRSKELMSNCSGRMENDRGPLYKSWSMQTGLQKPYDEGQTGFQIGMTSNIWLFYIFAALFGIDFGGISTIVSALAGDVFGR